MHQKPAVVYFSVSGETYFPDGNRDMETGNTRTVAGILAGILGVDAEEIVPAEMYPHSFKGQCDRAMAELDADARPRLSSSPDISGASDVYLLYPNWCGTIPMPVSTFLEANHWEGRRIHPVCTNEGSGMGRSEADIRRLAAGAEVLKGISIRGHEAPESAPALREWLDSEDE